LRERPQSGELVGKGVIDIAVMRLIGAHHDDDFAQACLGRKPPVFDGDCRRRNVGVDAAVDAGQILGIAIDSSSSR